MTGGSYSLLGRAKDGADDPDHAIPFVGFRLEPVAACGSQAVKFGAAIVLALAPFAGDGALVFQAVESGVKGSLLNHQFLTGDLLNAQKHSIAVEWPERNRL